MEFKLRKVMTIGTLVIGTSVTFAVPMAYAEDNGKVVFNMTPAEQAALYASIAKMAFVNGSGEVRALTPGENLEVLAHEENNSISFSTADGYTVNINELKSVDFPRNIFEGTALEGPQIQNQ